VGQLLDALFDQVGARSAKPSITIADLVTALRDVTGIDWVPGPRASNWRPEHGPLRGILGVYWAQAEDRATGKTARLRLDVARDLLAEAISDTYRLAADQFAFEARAKAAEIEHEQRARLAAEREHDADIPAGPPARGTEAALAQLDALVGHVLDRDAEAFARRVPLARRDEVADALQGTRERLDELAQWLDQALGAALG